MRSPASGLWSAIFAEHRRVCRREFAAQHSLAFPELSSVAVSSSLGPLGLEYVLAVGGAGYFRQNVVRNHINEGRLHRVPGAPEFLYPAYAVYSADADMTILAPALAGLRQAAEGSRSLTPAAKGSKTRQMGNRARKGKAASC